jgi:hypothetical protein
MKKIFFSLLFFLISTTFFAQASYSSNGIAVQGIARNSESVAYRGKTITLKFYFYYFDESNNEQPVNSEITKQVLTDNFGVFSTIINPSNSINTQTDLTPEVNSKFANQTVWLRITNNEDSQILQESQLMHVPYAISANNGVPTGTILPFMGLEADVPVGWLLCDGRAIPAGGLKTLLNSRNLESRTTPDLRGMFLRGAGSNMYSDVDTKLGTSYDDEFKSHTHDKGTLKTTNSGNHEHKYKSGFGSTAGIARGGHGANEIGSGVKINDTEGNGTHIHELQGTIGSIGGIETRPANYGVNYIIKL